MAALTKARAARRAQGRPFAVACSVAAHLAVFLALFWHFGTPSRSSDVEIMHVALVRLHKVARTAPPSAAKATAFAPSSRLQLHAPREGPPPPFTGPTIVTPAPANETSPGVRATLKGLLGCDHAALAGLSPAEREVCLERLGRRRTAEADISPGRLNLDRRGDYAAAKNPEAYLNRRPTNGCKVRAAGDVAPSGKEGAEAGVGCAVPF